MTPDLRTWIAGRARLAPDLLATAAFSAWLADRIASLELAGEADYRARLEQDAGELRAVIHAVAVPETFFFRYPASFELLVRHAAALRGARRNGDSLRLLSLPCATGAEPVSMVIAALHAGWPIERIHVDAVDSSAAALAVARSGVLPARALRDTLPAWAESMLDHSGDKITVRADVLHAIDFQEGDALDAGLFAATPPFDAVFCRNLIIYLDAAARQSLVRLLAQRVQPDGLLFVGHAECLAALDAYFHPSHVRQAFAYGAGPATDLRTDTRSAHAATTRPVSKTFRPAAPPEIHTQPMSIAAPFPSRPPQHSAASSRARPRVVAASTSIEHARELADAGRLEEAARAAEQLLAAAGPSSDVLVLLGTISAARGDGVAAERRLRQAIYLDPAHEDALLQLAALTEDHGRTSEAERLRRRAERAHLNREGPTT